VNIAKGVYDTTILLSIPGNDPSVADAVAACVEDIVLAASTPPARVIIHASRTLLGDGGGSTRRRSPKKLRSLMADGRVGAWIAGLSGEAFDLLRPCEVDDIVARRGGVVGTIGRRFFPHRIRRDQVDTLIAGEVPLCIGYPRVPRPGTVSVLQVWDPPRDGGTGWISVPTLHIRTDDIPPKDPEQPPSRLPSRTGETAEEAIGIVHLVLPRGDATTVAKGVRTRFPDVWAGVVEGFPGRAATSSDSPPDRRRTMWVSGVAPYAPGREPAILAALDRLRCGYDEAPDDGSRIPGAAADADTVVDRILRRRRDVSTGPGGTGTTRELEGAGTGYFTLSEGAFRVLFIGGRICGVFPRGDSPGSPEDTPPGGGAIMNGTRAQGHLRVAAADSRAGGTGGTGEVSGVVHYLETVASAWFSSGTTRGVQERAALPGGIVIDSEAVMVDGVPALFLTQSVVVPENPIEGARELVLFEIPLGSVGSAQGIAAEYLPGDEVTCRIAPSDDPEAEREIVLSARHLVVAPSGTRPVRITPADRSGALIVPYHLAMVPKNGRDQFVLRLAPPLSADPGRPMSWPEIRRWSVSWIVTPEGDQHGNGVDSPAVTAEVRGFTADLSPD